MWQPWLSWIGQGDSAAAHYFFANSDRDVASQRIAPLICLRATSRLAGTAVDAACADMIVATGTDGDGRHIRRGDPTRQRRSLGRGCSACRS